MTKMPMKLGDLTPVRKGKMYRARMWLRARKGKAYRAKEIYEGIGYVWARESVERRNAFGAMLSSYVCKGYLGKGYDGYYARYFWRSDKPDRKAKKQLKDDIKRVNK